MHREDNILWQKIKKGNQDAFKTVFKKYYNSLCNFSLRYTGDFQISEEIVQNLFVNLWERKKNLDIYSLKTYLYKSTYNNCLQYLKHENIKMNYANNEKDSKNLNFQNEYIEHEINDIVNQTLKKMPEKIKQIFVMSRFDGLKYNEIARTLSISVKTVEANITKALKILRKNLSDYL